jgi:hypothetical protein
MSVGLILGLLVIVAFAVWGVFLMRRRSRNGQAKHHRITKAAWACSPAPTVSAT